MNSGYIEGYPFREGEEHLARSVLEHPPFVSGLKFVSHDFKSSERPGLILFYRMLWVGPLLGVVLLGLGVLDWEWSSLGAMVFAILLPPVMVEIAEHFSQQPRPSIEISPERKLILIDNESVARFNDLGVPRLVLLRRKIGADVWESPAISMEHRVGPDVILFDFRVPRELLARLPQIAEHVNAIFVEHEQREAIREWLDAREAEIASSKGYR